VTWVLAWCPCQFTAIETQHTQILRTWFCCSAATANLRCWSVISRTDPPLLLKWLACWLVRLYRPFLFSPVTAHWGNRFLDAIGKRPSTCSISNAEAFDFRARFRTHQHALQNPRPLSARAASRERRFSAIVSLLAILGSRCMSLARRLSSSSWRMFVCALYSSTGLIEAWFHNVSFLTLYERLMYTSTVTLVSLAGHGDTHEKWPSCSVAGELRLFASIKLFGFAKKSLLFA